MLYKLKIKQFNYENTENKTIKNVLYSFGKNDDGNDTL